jgi:hypothetical protein
MLVLPDDGIGPELAAAMTVPERAGALSPPGARFARDLAGCAGLRRRGRGAPAETGRGLGAAAGRVPAQPGGRRADLGRPLGPRVSGQAVAAALG